MCGVLFYFSLTLEPTLVLVERAAVHSALAAGFSDVPQLLGQLQDAQTLLGDLRGGLLRGLSFGGR